MTSVLALLKIIRPSESTTLAQFGRMSPLAQLEEVARKKYFDIPPNAVAADKNKLAIQVGLNDEGNKREFFNLTRAEHIKFIAECIKQFDTSSSRLRAIDTKITASVVTGIVASSLSFLPLIGFLTWAAWGAAVYYINQRGTAYDEYNKSLNLLAATCNWSLGEHDSTARDSLQGNQTLRHMMATLYPVLTKAQVKHLIADEIEAGYVEEFEAYEKKLEEGYKPELHKSGFFTKRDELAVSQKCTEFNRCIYGLDKGGIVDFLDALASALPDLYRMAYHSCQHIKIWWQGGYKTPVDAPKNDAPGQGMSASV